jgi:hypothetical protein
VTCSLLEYYRKHGPMTEIKEMDSLVADIPADIPTIVSYVQNILLHEHWSEAYGVELSDARRQEPLMRSFEEKLVFLRDKGFTHVSEGRTNQDKMFGICRDFSVVSAALCREAGIPARARCGFAAYFEPGKYIDHWVLEYWHQEQERWIMADAQLDELQQSALKIEFDPLDIDAEQFITAPRAWLMCRQGKANPDLFGIFQWWGYDYLRCNLLLDANSLLKMPMQPWDGWDGYKILPLDRWTDADYAVLDKLASLALLADQDFQTFSDFVSGHEKIRVPADLAEVYTPTS